MTPELFSKTDQYISDLLAPEDEVLANIERSLVNADASMPYASVSASQGKFLQVLAKMCNAKRILELGALGGYSTIWMARALPADGHIITVEYDENHAAVAQRNIDKAGVTDKVTIRQGKCMDILQELSAEKRLPFDMIFIDADKPPYAEYFQMAVTLSRPGSIIVADNVVRNGKVLDDNSSDSAVLGVQKFNKMLAGNKDVTATILQMVGTKEWDGMAIAVVN